MSWLPVSIDSHFPIQNIPFGIFSLKNEIISKVCTRIGDHVIDLSVLYDYDLFNNLDILNNVFDSSTLNKFMSLDCIYWKNVRKRIISLLSIDGNEDNRLRSNICIQERAIYNIDLIEMHLPAFIGDYTDFYCSREHATNCGVMLRGIENALQPNWLHLPVGYHGRASSVVRSGTNFRRPWGQIQKDKANPKQGSIFSTSQALDFELEIGFFLGGNNNELGVPIKMADAESHIFGLVLLNDWSARDIQAWEYTPLGPFTAKNFCTSISPWVITLDALKPFKCNTSAGNIQADPIPLPYLIDPHYDTSTYDICLQVYLDPKSEDGSLPSSSSLLCESNLKYMYWNLKQQLVHHSITGCRMNPGDLIGTGTISGPEYNMYGSMMELSWKGTKDIILTNHNINTNMRQNTINNDNQSEIDHNHQKELSLNDNNSTETQLSNSIVRRYLEDGDTVRMTGFVQGNNYRIGFGELVGTVLPAIENPF